MKKLFAVLLFSVLPTLANAQSQFDLSFPNGLTVSMYGASNLGCPECGMAQGGFMLRFSENLNQSWFSNCLNQRFYIAVENAGGKALYQAVLVAQLTGKKITRILGNTPNPSAYNICTLNWAQVE